MKKILIVLAGVLLFTAGESMAQCGTTLVQQCQMQIGDKATYFREFIVHLKRAKKGKTQTPFKGTIVLNKNTHYRFTLCNAAELEGEGVVQLFDGDRLMGSSFDVKQGKDYRSIEVYIKKTALYQVYISFKKGLEGCCVVIVSIVD